MSVLPLASSFFCYAADFFFYARMTVFSSPPVPYSPAEIPVSPSLVCPTSLSPFFVVLLPPSLPCPLSSFFYYVLLRRDQSIPSTLSWWISFCRLLWCLRECAAADLSLGFRSSSPPGSSFSCFSPDKKCSVCRFVFGLRKYHRARRSSIFVAFPRSVPLFFSPFQFAAPRLAWVTVFHSDIISLSFMRSSVWYEAFAVSGLYLFSLLPILPDISPLFYLVDGRSFVIVVVGFCRFSVWYIELNSPLRESHVCSCFSYDFACLLPCCFSCLYYICLSLSVLCLFFFFADRLGLNSCACRLLFLLVLSVLEVCAFFSITACRPLTFVSLSDFFLSLYDLVCFLDLFSI